MSFKTNVGTFIEVQMQSQARTGVTQDQNVGLLGINFKALKKQCT